MSTPSGTSAAARVALFRELFGHLADSRDDLFRFWVAPFQALPFRLGESLAEVKVPFAFDDAFDRLATQAVADLIALLQRRFAPTVSDGGLEAKLVLREECMSPRFTTRGGLEQEAVLLAARIDPHLDCGLLDSWLSRGASGSKLLSGLEAIFIRAMEETVNSRGLNSYAYLTTLAIADLLEQKKALVKATSLRAVGYERLEKAIGLGLFAVVEVAARSALDTFGRKELGVDIGGPLLQMRTALNPLTYVSIKSRALQNDVNPWGVSPREAASLERVYEEVLQRHPKPASLEQHLRAAVDSQPVASDAVKASGLRHEARSRFMRLLAHFDDGRTDWLRMVTSVVRRDSELDALLGNHRSLAAIRRHLDKLARGQRVDDAGLAHIAEVTALIDAVSRGDPTQRHYPGMPSPSELAETGLTSYLAFVLDRFIDGRLEEARGHLRHARQSGDSPSVLAETWKAGRLYRFSADGRPFLLPMRRSRQGQLFIDLKGFTRRTHRAKEVVMADFMRERFYEPILQAARSRVSGLSAVGEEVPIELHNLLGDAAAFAGSARDLIELGRQLRRIGCEYADRLEAAAPSLAGDSVLEDLARQMEAQEEESRERMEELRSRMASVREEMERKAGLPQTEKVLLLEGLFDARYRELAEMRTRLEQRLSGGDERAEALRGQIGRLERWEKELRQRHETTRDELSRMSLGARDAALSDLLCGPDRRKLTELTEELGRAESEAAGRRRVVEERRRDVRGFGLETGIYISHGASAEVIAFDDSVFGQLRVAISEKINEAARGTARNPEIKAKMDAVLDRSRQERGRLDLTFPFLVYVDSAYSLVLPPDLSGTFERAVSQGDTSLAEETATHLARWALRDLYRTMGVGDGKPPEMIHLVNDIHNLGVALSQEALGAFIEETLASRFHFHHAVEVAELHEEFEDPFVFLDDALSLVVSVPADKKASSLEEVLVFRYAGNVQFRGFERAAATGVYELLSPDTRFHRLLRRHHLADWIADAREDPGRVVTRLETAG